jgi:hypothetical protein
MKPTGWIRGLFLLAALYDGVLGVWFLVAPGHPFELFEVTPPNHMGYVQFPAALLLIFGLMFLSIAREPAAHRDLILYGILLKIAYCGVASYHWATAGIPWIWQPFVIIDAVMGVLFVLAFFRVRGR